MRTFIISLVRTFGGLTPVYNHSERLMLAEIELITSSINSCNNYEQLYTTSKMIDSLIATYGTKCQDYIRLLNDAFGRKREQLKTIQN